MTSSLRAKFALIALTAAIALVIVAVTSALAARDVTSRLDAIRENLVPRIEARPRMESDFDQLRRGFQDAVAAEDVELLEQTLLEYPGTLLLVSLDRRFLDNVVTQVLAPEGGGLWREYVGGYGDWVRQRPAGVAARAQAVEHHTWREHTRRIVDALKERCA